MDRVSERCIAVNVDDAKANKRRLAIEHVGIQRRTGLKGIRAKAGA